MKKKPYYDVWQCYITTKTWKIMRLSAFFLLLSIANIWATSSYSQNMKLTLKLDNSRVVDVLEEIENNSDFYFLFNQKLVDIERQVNVNVKNKTINEILEEVFDGTNVSYVIKDRQIVLTTFNEEVFSEQIGEIRGKVTDIYGSPLPGANVMVKGTDNGTITDNDGNYILTNIPEGAILQFSFIGMLTEEVLVEDKTTIDISLIEDIAKLDEVVVVGYGSMKKSDLTGSISQVKAEDLQVVSGSNPIQALQGRASGVSVLTNNNPGSSPTLRIRGSGSITASNDPLYVVDGFPLMDNDLTNINASDIESIEILKDASSTAIYGSRGANGVILITTKSGSKGKNEIAFSYNYGIQKPARLIDYIDRDDFVSFINEAYNYTTANEVYTSSDPAPGYNTNWEKEIIKNSALMKNYSLSFSGGNDKTTYMISGGVFSQDGLVDASGYKRYTARTNLTHEYNKWLTIGTHIQASRSEKENRDNPTGNIARYGWPTTPIKNSDGSWYYASQDPTVSSYFEGLWNPVSDADEITDLTTTDRVLGDIYAQFQLHKNLTFKSNIGVDISDAKKYNYSTSESTVGIRTGTGEGGQKYYRRTTKLTENILTYSNIWANKHRFTATGVYSYQDFLYESLEIEGSGFTNDGTGANDMTLADPESVSYESDKYSNKLISFTTRLAYTYNDKYILTATGRYDGSSRFGKNNKWGFFPSAGLSWRVDQEPFMEQLEKTVSNLKLRASVGVTGNQEIGNYESLAKMSSVYYIFNDTPILGFTEGIGNSDLRWERTAQTNLGADLGLWNRIDLTFDYYSRKTTDLLYDVPIPTTSGYNSMLQNVGEVQNHGIEITLHTRILNKNELKWDVTGNISKNKNEVTELYGDVTEINLGTSSSGLAKYLKVGEPVTGLWARESAGIIKNNEQLAAYQEIRSSANLGEEMYVDQDGSKSIDSDDFICIGSTEPDFIYGISTSVEYKKFRLDLYGQGAYRYASLATISYSSFKDYSVGYASTTSGTSAYYLYGENQLQNRIYMPSKYAYERMWSEDNTDGDYPRAGAQGVYASDRTNGDWSYFLLKNVKLSYQLDKSVIKWINRLTIYVNLQNYVNWANHRGYNPENGDDTYPWAKTMVFGIDAKF